MTFTRQDVLTRLQDSVESGTPIIGASAGTGISAKFAERGGVDIIGVYNSGLFRMGGRGSLASLLPYGDANEIVLESGREVIPIVEETPVIAGVCGTDPFREMDSFLPKIKQMGFCGIQNFPTVGLYDGTFRQHLEETGMSYEAEIELIETARDHGLLTCAYVFDTEQTEAMTNAGADLVVAHMGLTTKGDIGAETSVSLEEAATRVQEFAGVAKGINPDVHVICHGGPIAEPEDVRYVLRETEDVDGFFAGSSIERLATETAIREQSERFKELSL